MSRIYSTLLTPFLTICAAKLPKLGAIWKLMMQKLSMWMVKLQKWELEVL